MIRAAAVAALFLPATLGAQTLQPEVRADVFGPPPYSGGPGIGATMALGYYVRVNAGVGYELPMETGRTGDRWRAELIARATFDPFRQQRWALSIGGGLTQRRSNTYLAAIIDVEGPEIRGLLPALQLGVSGGVRAGLVVRRAIPGRR
jgi:hypothetical protein